MEFTTLGKQERKLLLKALEFDFDSLHCEHCEEFVTYDKCGIMPKTTKTSYHATILCDSPLCMAWYLTTIEDDEEAKKLRSL